MATKDVPYVDLDAEEQLWYETELNTAELVRAVLKARRAGSLSGDDLWNLLRLTWITVYGQEPTSDHWKRLKLPALAALFKSRITVLDDLSASVSLMQLPAGVKRAAVRTTGMVNFRGVWRNSSLEWCRRHQKRIRSLVWKAFELPANDQQRYDLAREVMELPGVPSPNDAADAGADTTLTPLLAALDPFRRFPIVNGREGVQELLRALNLGHRDLEEQTRGLVGLVGNFGIADSFMIDVKADKIAELPLPAAAGDLGQQVTESKIDGPDLRMFDEDERKAVIRSRTISYRARHNKMTNRLRSLLDGLDLKMGYGHDDRYDVLIKDYDQRGRDLLVEAKPDSDRGSIRIAIGQLFDYRRRLAHQTGTDLAVLTITPPTKSYRELLLQLQITALWYVDDDLLMLSGEGKAWLPLNKVIPHSP